MIHALDRSGDIRICPIQTPMGQDFLRLHGLSVDNPESWLFLEGDRVWRDFDALIRVGERSGGWGRVFSALRLIPRPLRDWFYRRLARNRYTLFGKGDMCALPDPEFRKRLIE